MLEQKKLPILEALAAFGIGGIFTAACMAGLAYLMANQSLAQSIAWPMVSAIVCAGSFCSGWLMAFFYHSRGLICGAVQGGLFVLLLLGFGLSEGIEPTEMQLTRFALVFVFGCSASCVQNGTGIENLQQKNRRTGKYVGLSGNTGNRSGKSTARSNHADSTGRAAKTEKRWSSS